MGMLGKQRMDQEKKAKEGPLMSETDCVISQWSLLWPVEDWGQDDVTP